MVGWPKRHELKERDMVQVKHDKARGILDEEAAQGITRFWPSEDLAPFVEHYWIVRWNLAEPRIAETLPHPSVHMVLEEGRSAVVGVMRGKFSRVIEGRGRVVATKFRPGGFRAFVDRSIAFFTDHRWPLPGIFGPSVEGFDAEVLSHDDDVESVKVVESFLRSFSPAASDAIGLAGQITARIADDRTITRVDQIAEQFAMTLRQMQRLFRDYVGVTPKWVIQRYRLIEGAERIAAGAVADFASLALDLGYADQAHFIRHFKKIVGRAPAGFARRIRERQAMAARQP
jgi:AraC-like DNA-binding protein